jgi:hypothetical protein
MGTRRVGVNRLRVRLGPCGRLGVEPDRIEESWVLGTRGGRLGGRRALCRMLVEAQAPSLQSRVPTVHLRLRFRGWVRRVRWRGLGWRIRGRIIAGTEHDRMEGHAWVRTSLHLCQLVLKSRLDLVLNPSLDLASKALDLARRRSRASLPRLLWVARRFAQPFRPRPTMGRVSNLACRVLPR